MGITYLAVQSDGNVVLRTGSNRAMAHTGTHGNSGQGVFLRLGNDGNVVVYRPRGSEVTTLWSMNEDEVRVTAAGNAVRQ